MTWQKFRSVVTSVGRLEAHKHLLSFDFLIFIRCILQFLFFKVVNCFITMFCIQQILFNICFKMWAAIWVLFFWLTWKENWQKGGRRCREKDMPFVGWLFKCSTIESEAGWSQKPGTPSGSPRAVVKTQILNSHLLPSWHIGRKGNQKQRSWDSNQNSDMECQCPKWQRNPLHCNACSSELHFEMMKFFLNHAKGITYLHIFYHENLSETNKIIF